jgi:hypothetical protein
MLLLGCLFASVRAIDDSKPLITQELVDKINNDPRSTFKARLNPQFARMTIAEAKKFLSPVRKNDPVNHGSPRPVGANERYFHNRDRRVFTGWYRPLSPDDPTSNPRYAASKPYTYTVYNNADFCSSWAPAVTSAMSLALSINHDRWVNLSIQFILDCDLMGDPCVERPPLNAYEQFWRRYIPQVGRWDNPVNPLRPPYYTLNSEDAFSCQSQTGCYPGWSNCPRNLVMTGSCEPGQSDASCPIYFLYNWRYIKSHLWEVGPVTSSVLVRPGFFAYDSGVYSALATTSETGSPPKLIYPKPGAQGNPPQVPGTMDEVLGMLDVTIIGWGQNTLNLSSKSGHTGMYNRWWYVIPHLGWTFGETCGDVFGADATTDTADPLDSILPSVECGAPEARSGIMRFNRRFDDSSIESQAVGAVPFNFAPGPAPGQNGGA